MVNAKHDTASYENCGYPREIFDGNLLYESFLRAKQGSDWKPQVQKFEMNYLIELAYRRNLKVVITNFSPVLNLPCTKEGKNGGLLVSRCGTEYQNTHCVMKF